MKQSEESLKPYLPILERGTIEKRRAPKSDKEPKQPVSVVEEPESFAQLLSMMVMNGLKSLPKIMVKILIVVAIVTAINFIIMTRSPYSSTGESRSILNILIFFTASRNGVVQRTIFWGILLTVGRRLLFQVKRDGIGLLTSKASRIAPRLKRIKAEADRLFIPIFLAGCGIGLLFANYLTRNHRFDKQGVSIVIAFTILGALIKQGRSLLILTLRLFLKDVVRIKKEKSELIKISECLLLGMSSGLVFNLIFALIKIDKGGYMAGSILIGLALAYYFIKTKGDEKHQTD